MKFSNNDYILYESFKNLFAPGRVISANYIMSRSSKDLGVRVSFVDTKAFFFKLQSEGFGKIGIVKPQPGFRRKVEDVAFFCKDVKKE